MAQNDNLSSSSNSQESSQGGGSDSDLQSALQKSGSEDVLSADPGREEGAKQPLSPEEYAQDKKEIEEQGDRNQSGHKNG